MVVVNLNDEEYLPIPESADGQKQIEKSTNAYFAIVGFNAAANEDMHQMGYKVIEEFERFVVDKDDFQFDISQVPRADRLKIRGNSNVIYHPNRDGKLLDYLAKNKQKIVSFKLKNAKLYDRYRELIRYKNYKETSFYLPAWSDVMLMHKLHLHLTGIEWLDGDKSKAVAMLSEVMTFNRMLLGDSELLITRMVATALLSISFQQYTEISSLCKTCTSLDQIIQPLSSLSRDDICLKESFYAELKYMKSIFIKTSLYSSGDENILYEPIIRYFYQPAASFNNTFEVYNNLLQTCKIETYEITPYIEKNHHLIEYHFPWYSFVYNPMGKYFLEGFNSYSLSSYIDLMLYLEVQLRMLQLQRLIYANKISPDDVAPYLNRQDKSLKNPFTNNPFKYDKKNHELFLGDDQAKNFTVQLRRN